MFFPMRKMASAALCALLCTMNAPLWASPSLPPTSRHAVRDGDPILTFAPRTERNFAEEAAALAKTGKATFVIEGVPLHPVLSPKTGPDAAANQTDFPQSLRTGPFGQYVENLADAFDYDLIRAENLFIFKKRYTDPKDLPCITLEETQNALKDIKNVIQSQSANNLPLGSYSSDQKFGAFLVSFSPSQLELLKQERLSVASLRPEQKEQIYRYAVTMYTENALLGAEEVARNVNAVLQKPGVFKTSNYLGKDVFGYRYGDPRDPYVIPLSTMRGRTPVVGGEILTFGKNRSNADKPFIDPTNPSDDDKALAEQEQKYPAQTLQGVVQRLNTKGKHSPLRLESGLNEKPMSLYGMENSAPEAVWQAVALLYNLRVIIDPENAQGLLLTYKKARVPRTLDDLGPCVLLALPAPYVRAVHWDSMIQGRKEAQERGRRVKAEREAAEGRGQSVPPLSAQQAEEKQKIVAAWDAQWARWGNATEEVRMAATRRFRASVEPKAKAVAVPDNVGVPLSALSATDKQNLATVLIGFTANELYGLAGAGMPRTLTKFNDLMLKGGSYIDKESSEPRFTLQVGFLRPDGNLDTVSGFANERLPKPANNQ